jgi:hypothetical protein
LWAPSIIGPSDTLADPIEVRFQFSGRIGLVEFGDRVPAVPEVLVFAFKECSDKVVLGAEMAIKACFGDSGFFDHEVNADGPHTSLIEERRRGPENSLPQLG